jgi:glucokinase
MLLAGDIGGTKTNLGVYSPGSGPRSPISEATFPSSRYPSLEALAQDFLGQINLEVKSASFGVAGPVVEGRAKVTNLPWEIEAEKLRKALNVSSVTLINDLEAIAHAVPFLEPKDLHTLNDGKSAAGGNLAVIAPGTGLGEAFLAWDGSRYFAYASEGGHADFAPKNSSELELLEYLMKKYEHVSMERVCSGIGIPNIYSFLKESGRFSEPGWLSEKLSQSTDPTPVIMRSALDEEKKCGICQETLRMFVSIMGSEAGNLVLKVFATGGVYLGGGIPPRILKALEDPGFIDSFLHKGRMKGMLSKVPIHVILNPKVALLGAACAGFAKL